MRDFQCCKNHFCTSFYQLRRCNYFCSVLIINKKDNKQIISTSKDLRRPLFQFHNSQFRSSIWELVMALLHTENTTSIFYVSFWTEKKNLDRSSDQSFYVQHFHRKCHKSPLFLFVTTFFSQMLTLVLLRASQYAKSELQRKNHQGFHFVRGPWLPSGATVLHPPLAKCFCHILSNNTNDVANHIIS